MNEDLKNLRTLQNIDSEIDSIERDKLLHEEKITDLEEKSNKYKKRVEESASELKELESKRKKKERELETEDENIKKSEEKSMQVKTNEEYQASLKEIETRKKNLTFIEDKIIEAIESVEEKKKANEEVEREAANIKKEYENFKKETVNQLNEFNGKITEKKKEKEDILSKMPENIVTKYKELKYNREGKVIVPIKDLVCQGCYMSIMPQMYYELKKGEKVETCPSCLRFIYHFSFDLEEDAKNETLVEKNTS